MTTTHESVTQDQDLMPATAGAKRPYLKPAFTSENVFETMALACGKVRGQGQDSCRRVTSAS